MSGLPGLKKAVADLCTLYKKRVDFSTPIRSAQFHRKFRHLYHLVEALAYCVMIFVHKMNTGFRRIIDVHPL